MKAAMNNAVSNTSPSYRHLPAISGANRRSKYVAHSHALTHAAKATRVYTTACAHTDAARPDKPLQSLQATQHATRTKHVKQLFHPSNQPVVQVFTAQTAIKFIVINTESQSSSNSASGSSVGLSYGTSGLSVNASANKSKGQGNGDDITYTNTRIQGSAVKLNSGGDTTLQGAVIAAGCVQADIGGNPFGSGGNLRIEL